MKIQVCENYDDMSQQAGDYVWKLIQSYSIPLICPSSGDTPTGLYKQLVGKSLVNNSVLDGLRFIGLDEWVGMDGSNEGSCRHYINQQLFHPLNMKEGHYYFFNGKATDLEKECTGAEEFIKKQGGIDIAILGVGMNGHAGFNEPGIDPLLTAHVALLDTTTTSVGQKYFHQQTELTKGITLGIASLQAARHVIILASGKKKAAIIKRVLQEVITNQVPAGLFRTHTDVVYFLDKEAASLL